MAGDTQITVIGNMVTEPEMKYTPSGAAVCNFRIASTPRAYNQQSQAWEDGESLFLACSIWRQAAENAASTLAKGMRVIVQGRLRQRSYETAQGEKRTVVELEVDELGVSLKNATAKVEKTGGSGQGRQQYEQAKARSSREGRADPWGPVPGGGQQAGGWGSGGQAQPAGQGAWGSGDDAPPF